MTATLHTKRRENADASAQLAGELSNGLDASLKSAACPLPYAGALLAQRGQGIAVGPLDEADVLQNGPMGFVLEFAAGQPSDAAIAWAQKGFGIWVIEPALSVEQCLRLPTTPAKRRLMLRNLWLAEAAAVVARDTFWERCVAVSDELNTFLTRGPWLTWRKGRYPPAEASSLRRALFHVLKANNECGLSPISIYRALKAIAF